MTRQSAALLIILFFLAQPQFVHGQTAKGSIEGVVRDAKSNEPIPGARVTLVWSPTPEQITGDPFQISAPAPIPAVTTDAQGRFSFADLAPNAYWLSAQANGYVRRDGGYFGPIQGNIINVSNPAPIKDLAVRLTPTGNVSGRIVGDHGEPAANVPVQLTKYGYNSLGQRNLMLTASTKTDDRGEYRLYFVAPGQYFVGAGTSVGPGREPNRTVSNEVAELYSYAYYPNVSEVEQASPVEVESGAEIKGIDMRLNPPKMHRIRGRVLDSRTGQPPAEANFSVNFSTPGGSGSYGSSPAYNAATGEFELQNVIPGSYGITVTVQIAPVPRGASPTNITEMLMLGQAQARARLLAYAPVKVVNTDVNGLLMIVGGFSITGQVRVEGLPISTISNVTQLQAQLRPVIDGQAVQVTNVAIASPVSPDGTFTVVSLPSGEYRLSMFTPPGYYIKEARLGDRDVLNNPLTLREAPSSTLEVLLSPKAGRVDGTVVDDRGRSAQASQVVLIPDRNRDRSELFLPAVIDQNGRFSVSNVPPGDYKLLAWESLEPYSYFDPEVLKRYEQLGKPVHVEESSRITIEVPRIPATP